MSAALRACLALSALSLAALFAALWLGPVPLSWDAFAQGDANTNVIIWEIRFPRALTAFLVGAALGIAGAGLQGLLRNPLADPGLFGIAPGAALGAVAALWFGHAVSAWLLPLCALIGAGGAMALLALIAGRSGGIALFTLAGLMVASLAGALTALAISTTCRNAGRSATCGSRPWARA